MNGKIKNIPFHLFNFSLWFIFIFSETNFKQSPKGELYDTAIGYILLCLTTLVLVSSLLSFAYTYLYLKLNGFIKTILYQMSIVGIVGSLIMIIGEAIILIKKEQTLTDELTSNSSWKTEGCWSRRGELCRNWSPSLVRSIHKVLIRSSHFQSRLSATQWVNTNSYKSLTWIEGS